MSSKDWRAFAVGFGTLAGAVTGYTQIRQIGEYVQDVMVMNMTELSHRYSWQIPAVCKPPVTLAIDPNPCTPPMPETALWVAVAAFIFSISLSLRIWAKPKK